ncbi:MAG: mercuric transporter MerT family protein [Acidobacteriota bacterium]
MEATQRKAWFGVGAILAAVGASLCCILPLGVVFLGVGSAALGNQLEPLRPYFTALTLLFLGMAFYQVYKPQNTQCAPGESCAVPENRRRQRILIWVVALIAVVFLSSPYYVGLIF